METVDCGVIKYNASNVNIKYRVIKMGKMFSRELDVINRDPNDINSYVKVSFEDVIAEPEGVRSSECIWRCSYCCFRHSQKYCYRLLTLLCGMCMACEWGCEFAIIAFIHIWHVTPMLKICEINCGWWQKLWATCIRCCLDPCCESCSLLFSAFKRQ